MAFAHLTYRESLRDIEACPGTQPWQICADLAQRLIGIARPLYAKEPTGIDPKETVWAFDSTTIDLCLSAYPWAPFRSATRCCNPTA